MKRERIPDYVRRAKRRFLEGLWHRTPIDAVLAGKRTLDQWTDLLNEERELARGGAPGQPRVPAGGTGRRSTGRQPADS